MVGLQMKNYIAQRTDLLNWLNQLIDSSAGVGKTEILLAKTALLMERSLKEMSNEERVELALTYCKLYPNIGNAQKCESPILQREIQRRWLKMIPEWIAFFEQHDEKKEFFFACISKIDPSIGKYSQLNLETAYYI